MLEGKEDIKKEHLITKPAYSVTDERVLHCIHHQ